MWHPADLTFWILAIVVEAFVVYLFVIQGLFWRFLFLNLYVGLCVTSSIGRYVVLYDSGVTSHRYFYFYYFSDGLLTVFLFLSICELSVRLAGTKTRRRKVALMGAGVLVATAWFSFAAVSQSSFMTTHFAYEFSQNLYYVCGLALVLLWIWKLRNKLVDPIAARLVTVLTVYFSLYFLVYAATQFAFPLVSYAPALGKLYPMIGAWLPLGCGFAALSDE